MSDLDDPLKRKTSLTADEAAAARLTRAASAQGEVPPHDSIGDHAWKKIDAQLQLPVTAKAWSALGKPLIGVALATGAAVTFYALTQQQPVSPVPRDSATVADSATATDSAPVTDPAPATNSAAKPPLAPSEVHAESLRLSDALELVRRGRYTEAEKLYRKIASEQPAQSEVALYALAKMKLQKQKDIDAGLALLDELDRVHPKGKLRQERQLTRIEVLLRTARCKEAQLAVSTYAKDFTHATDRLRDIDASQCAPK